VKLDNTPPRGMRDLLPAQVAVRDGALARIAEVYARFGYQRIETPALEDIRRLTSDQGGENEKLIFQVLKRGLGERIPADTPVRDLVDLGLRFDLTVPLARYYGNNQASLPSPFRSLQAGPVWRAERPQKGRFRQFMQCDIDIMGEASVFAEAELIEATTEALAAVGLSAVTVRLSDRRFLTALADSAGLAPDRHGSLFIALDKLDKIGWDGVAEELERNGVAAEALAVVRERIESLQNAPHDALVTVLANALPNIEPKALDDLATLTACLDALRAARGVEWRFDPTLVRGMGYYTGPIFELSHTELSYSIAGGGRYDKLIGRTLGRDVPATGFSIGIERIADLVQLSAERETVALLFEEDVALPAVVAKARELRETGRSVVVARRSGKMAPQLTRLEDAGIGSYILMRAGSEALEEKQLNAPRPETAARG
jgi:histidyl-tRNA synthetase